MSVVKVKNFKPIIRETMNKLFLQFNYKSLSITREDELYEFIPMDEVYIVLDKKKGIIENKSSTFVFERSKDDNRVVHLELKKLLEFSDLGDYVADIFKKSVERGIIEKSEYTDAYRKMSKKDIDVAMHDNVRDVRKDEIEILINELEKQNTIRLLWKGIDDALDNSNKELFEKLSKELNDLLTNVTNNGILNLTKK